MRVAQIGLAGLLCASFMLIGLAKVSGLPASLVVRDRVGVPPRLWTVIGLLEILGAFGVVVGAFAAPGLGVAAAVGLAVLSAGAAVSHLRVHDAPAAVAAPVVLGVLAAVEAALLLTG